MSHQIRLRNTFLSLSSYAERYAIITEDNIAISYHSILSAEFDVIYLTIFQIVKTK